MCIHRIGLPTMWRCICDCGNKAVVRLSSLVSGSTKSCGCIVRGRKFVSTRFIEYDGKTHSLVDWAKMRNILPSTLRGRLRAGWSVAQSLAFEDPPERRLLVGGNVFKAKLIIYDGELFEVRELAAKFSISPTIVLSRLRAGWSIEEAIGEIPRIRNKGRYAKRFATDALDARYTGPKGTVSRKWRM